MGNHESRQLVDHVHILMAFARTKDQQKTACIRTVIKNFQEDLEIMKAKLRVLGGEWRIHKTVNPRDVKKAMNVLIHTLLDYPEKASYIDSAWRTALLQRECIYGEPKFMLDVDTKDKAKQNKIEEIIAYKKNVKIYDVIETPSGGRHIITNKFDTREVIALGEVTLLRDGYVFVEKIAG